MLSSIGQNLISFIYIFGININNFLITYFGIKDSFINSILNNLPTSRIYLSILFFFSFFLFFYFNKKSLKNFFEDYKELLISIFLLIFIYTIFFWPEHFYKRYFSIILVFSIPFFVVMIIKLFQNNKQKIRVIFCLNFILIIFFCIFSYQSFFNGRISNLQLITTNQVNSKQYNKIGVFQSGVFGYFHENVINLDGKANFEILSHIKNNNIDEYLKNEDKINY